jgi:hypothetical protein
MRYPIGRSGVAIAAGIVALVSQPQVAQSSTAGGCAACLNECPSDLLELCDIMCGGSTEAAICYADPICPGTRPFLAQCEGKPME